MSDYKEELSALVERIKQDGAKEERERILDILSNEEKICVPIYYCPTVNHCPTCRKEYFSKLISNV